MLLIPSYYKKFKCDPALCKHNCCIGWEIDVDEETLGFYKNYQGKLSEKLNKSIDYDSECPHFILGENERCPFLNNKNLCEIVLEMGEDKLCDICSDHPRFRNFYDDRVEMGLGLCCEIAGRLILSETTSFYLMESEGGKEFSSSDSFNAYRNKIFSVCLNREKSVDERIKNLLKLINYELLGDFGFWKNVYSELEMLGNDWNELLNKISESEFNYDYYPEYEICFEQLLMYFIYRHLSYEIKSGDEISVLNLQLIFSVLSFYMVKTVYIASEDLSFDNLVEISRMYSSEVEYSDENLDRIYEEINTFMLF